MWRRPRTRRPWRSLGHANYADVPRSRPRTPTSPARLIGEHRGQESLKDHLWRRGLGFWRSVRRRRRIRHASNPHEYWRKSTLCVDKSSDRIYIESGGLVFCSGEVVRECRFLLYLPTPVPVLDSLEWDGLSDSPIFSKHGRVHASSFTRTFQTPPPL